MQQVELFETEHPPAAPGEVRRGGAAHPAQADDDRVVAHGAIMATGSMRRHGTSRCDRVSQLGLPFIRTQKCPEGSRGSPQNGQLGRPAWTSAEAAVANLPASEGLR